MPFVPYHTHTFDIPTATDAEVAAGVVADKVVTPSSLGTAAVEDATAFATAAQGALSDKALQSYDSAISLSSANVPASVDFLRTNGYYAADGRGKAQYRRMLGPEANQLGQIVSADGARWALAEGAKVDPEMFGAGVSRSAAENTAGFQHAMDYIVAVHTFGEVYVQPGASYELGQSTLDETYINDTVSQPASTGCLVVRSGIRLVCNAGYAAAKIYCNDRTLTVLLAVNPQNIVIRGLEISNAWTVGLSGAGHGFLTLRTAEAALSVNCCFEDLYIHNVGSYGLSMQNGFPRSCRINNVNVYYSGADGIDLKARGEDATVYDAYGNSVTNCTITQHGSRVTGSAGIDVRGIWQIANVTVRGFGSLNTALGYTGLRFRTKADPALLQPQGQKSTLTGFFVDCSEATGSTGAQGLEIGSDDVHVSNGTIINPNDGVSFPSNVNGGSERSTVVNVNVSGAKHYGFYNAGSISSKLIGCTSKGAIVAGFRDEGTNTQYTDCESIDDALDWSTSAGANPTQSRIGCRKTGASPSDFLSVFSPAAGRLTLQATGPETDIDLLLSPKGAGLIRAFSSTAATTPASFTADRYITFRDNASGVTYRIPCRASAW
jgi:hypothetical protein